MNTQQIIKDIGDITLGHMSIDIDAETMLLDDYPGAERHLAVFIVQGFYHRFLAKLGENADKGYLEKALTHSKWFAINRLTQELPGLIDRATIFMLDEAKHSGWFVDMEYDSIADLLASMYDDEDASASERSDYSFIADTLLPVAKSYKVDTDSIIGASVQTKKLRGMVPHARELLYRHEAGIVTDQEVGDTLKWMIGAVADTKLSYSQMKNSFNAWHGKVKDEDQPIVGYQIIVTGGQTWMLVPTDSEKDRAMVEQALRSRVEFKLTGMDFLLNSVNAMFKRTNGRADA